MHFYIVAFAGLEERFTESNTPRLSDSGQVQKLQEWSESNILPLLFAP